MDNSKGGVPSRGHSRNKSGAIASRPRSSTKGPLDAPDEKPLASPVLSQAQRLSGRASQNTSPRTSMTQGRSPTAQSAPPLETPVTTRDFSFLLRPEIYHQISPLTIPPPFRNPAKLPSADTPIPKLLEDGHFRAAAIAAAQELTGSSLTPGSTPVNPTDHRRIFDLLYIRLSCLCLIDAVPLAAQEAKALEDLNSAFYTDEETGAHLAPWPLRTIAVRLQTIGFGDSRRAVMSYYELAREARVEVARAAKSHDHSAAEMWKRRLADLGIKVAGALIEMEDLAGAAAHLASLPEAQAQALAHDNEEDVSSSSSSSSSSSRNSRDGGRAAMCRALLWLHLGDVDAARRCISSQQQDIREETVGRVIDALADMADGDYDTALQKWKTLWDEMRENEINDEMVGVNLAVCLLYTGRMSEARDILEGLVNAGQASHTLLFNLTTMYELCTDRSKSLKMQLAERVADMDPAARIGGWEKTNADFKL